MGLAYKRFGERAMLALEVKEIEDSMRRLAFFAGGGSKIVEGGAILGMSKASKARMVRFGTKIQLKSRLDAAKLRKIAP